MTYENLLTELRLQFERYIAHKERLDNKANALLTISGTVGTLLLGIGVIFFNSIVPNYINSFLIIAIFIISFILIVLTIIFSISVHILRNYFFPVDESTFMSNDKVDDEDINEYAKASDDNFYRWLIKNYITCSENNFQSNQTKIRLLQAGHICFIIGITILIPLMFLMLQAYYDNAITSPSIIDDFLNNNTNSNTNSG